MLADRRDNEEITATEPSSTYSDTEMRSANLILAATLEHMTQGVCFFDKNQRLVLCNQMYADIYNLPADVTRPGTTLRDIVERRCELGSAPSMSPAEYVQWRDELRGPGKQFSSQVRLQNGKTILISHHPTHDDGWVATHEDITHRLRTEEVARRVEKMESVARLTAGIAHEFNIIFQTISVVLELAALVPGVAADAKLLASIEDATLAVMSGGNLTQRLLTISHKQAATLVVVDVGEFIRAAADLLHRACGDTIKIAILPEGGPFPVLADVEEFRSALLNLVRNAAEAMPSGGSIDIGIENVDLDGDNAEAAGVSPGGYVQLRVKDTGTGIAPGDLGRVFEPFFTTKPFGVSSGLGLAQVQSTAYQSGGAASIVSVLGESTTVTMLLARVDPAVSYANRQL